MPEREDLNPETPEARPAAADPTGTLERGLRLLQCFTAQTPVLGNSELAEKTGLPRPTVSRLTSKLVALGYLRRSEEGGFEVGTAVLCLSYSVLDRFGYRRLSLPHLRELAQTVGGVATVSVRDRLRIVTLEAAVNRDVLGRKPETGNSVTIVGTGVGLGWMVGATARERDGLWREIAGHKPKTLDRARADCDAALRQMADSGFVSRRNSIRPDTCVLAVPLRRRTGEDVLILACAVVTRSETQAAMEASAATALLQTAKRINARRFGH